MTTITELPDPPSRADPTTFAARGDAFLGALPAFATEANQVAEEVNANKLAAALSETNAAGYAAAAQAAAGSATKWNAATSYNEGDVVWSPLNGKAYRRKSPGGVVATDPSQDATNWFDVLSLSNLNVVVITTDTDAQPNTRYVINGNNVTLTLPAGEQGMIVGFIQLPGVTGFAVDPGGDKIRAVAEVMNVDIQNASTDLFYSGATNGWV